MKYNTKSKRIYKDGLRLDILLISKMPEWNGNCFPAGFILDFKAEI